MPTIGIICNTKEEAIKIIHFLYSLNFSWGIGNEDDIFWHNEPKMYCLYKDDNEITHTDYSNYLKQKDYDLYENIRTISCNDFLKLMNEGE